MPCDSDEALDQGHRAPWLIIQALCSCTRGQRRRPSCRDRRRSPGRHLAHGLAALERLKEPNSRSQMPAECTRRPLKLAERRCAAKPAAGRAGGAPGGGLCFCSFRYENQPRPRDTIPPQAFGSDATISLVSNDFISSIRSRYDVRNRCAHAHSAGSCRICRSLLCPTSRIAHAK